MGAGRGTSGSTAPLHQQETRDFPQRCAHWSQVGRPWTWATCYQGEKQGRAPESWSWVWASVLVSLWMSDLIALGSGPSLSMAPRCWANRRCSRGAEAASNHPAEDTGLTGAFDVAQGHQESPETCPGLCGESQALRYKCQGWFHSSLFLEHFHLPA